MSFLSEYFARREKEPRVKIKGWFPRRLYLRFPLASEGKVGVATFKDLEGRRLEIIDRTSSSPDASAAGHYLLAARPFVGGAMGPLHEFATFARAADANDAMSALQGALTRRKWRWLWILIIAILVFNIAIGALESVLTNAMQGGAMSGAYQPPTMGAGPLSGTPPGVFPPNAIPKAPPAMPPSDPGADPFGNNLTGPSK
jgi:hypothetical protein